MQTVSTGVHALAHPTITLNVVTSKSLSTGQTNPPEKLGLQSPSMVPPTHPGRAFSFPTQVRPFLTFPGGWSPLTRPIGGPGGSGIDLILGYGALLSNMTGGYYDIVSWDPRGVGQTT